MATTMEGGKLAATGRTTSAAAGAAAAAAAGGAAPAPPGGAAALGLLRLRLRLRLLLLLLVVEAAAGAFWLPSPTTTATPISSSPSPTTLPSNPQRSFGLRRRVRADDGYDDEEDEEDDDEPPDVDVANFRPPSSSSSSAASSRDAIPSYGLNRGRSSPSQRKAMGMSGNSAAVVHVCTSCGSEFVKWMGRCPTCNSWNTIQEHVVSRSSRPDPFSTFSSSSTPRPAFGGIGGASRRRHASWLDGLSDYDDEFGGMGGAAIGSVPVRLTDLCGNGTSPSGATRRRRRRRRRERIEIPGDFELSTVLGGGIVPGSLTLLGGDPGVGKSTLLLQAAAAVASLSAPVPGIGMGPPEKKKKKKGEKDGCDDDDDDDIGPVWYVSGEENPDQIASRASRLGIGEGELYLLSETHADTLCERIASELRRSSSSAAAAPSDFGGGVDGDVDGEAGVPSFLRKKPPSLVVVDSIQTMVCDAGGASLAGGVTQVRECVALLLRLCKSTGVSVVLVGHVTKSGDVAGPRTVEHMVDCVLYLEGCGGSGNVRMLRASKNRFGSCEEVGIYEMSGGGRLVPVSDPSSLFLANRVSEDDVEGCSVAIVLEGMRAMAVEIQALVTPATAAAAGGGGFGRRTVNGISYPRLQLLLGVLQKRCGVFLARQDIYVNVVGRIRLDRTAGEGNAADVSVAVALVSSLESIPVRADTAFVGEVGLLGELRPVESLQKRLSEARRMGFSRLVTPREVMRTKGRRDKSYTNQSVKTSVVNGVEWIQCETLLDAINVGLVNPVPKRSKKRRKKGGVIVDELERQETPGSLEELGLEEIMDDEDDEDANLI